MRVGIFGGTFDPPHLGHVLACLWALETGEIDAVIMIPTARHAFGKKPGADFSHRMAMCEIAMRHLSSYISVSDIENRREGTSYMADTLRDLAAGRPGDTFRLIIGSDVVEELSKWRESAEVIRMAPLLALPRTLSGKSEEGALPLISSTAVRSALRNRNDARKLVGKSVLDYIETHSLYQDPTSEGDLP